MTHIASWRANQTALALAMIAASVAPLYPSVERSAYAADDPFESFR